MEKHTECSWCGADAIGELCRACAEVVVQYENDEPAMVEDLWADEIAARCRL